MCPTDEFRRIHESILDRWNYPPAVRNELTQARERWIAANMREDCCKSAPA